MGEKPHGYNHEENLERRLPCMGVSSQQTLNISRPNPASGMVVAHRPASNTTPPQTQSCNESPMDKVKEKQLRAKD
eukprot:35050-Rhodomonas_salina.2